MPTEKLYLLDRNAVDCIKAANLGRVQTDQNKVDLLERLKSLDQPGYNVSPLLSVIEGERGREDTAEEKQACVLKETEALRTFYKVACVDSSILTRQAQLVGETFSANREEAWPARESFLRYALPLLVGGVASEKRAALERQLLEQARKDGLSLCEPTVMLVLAALYGGQAAGRVLKPKAQNFYNTLSDIHIISRVGYILALSQEMGVPRTIKVVTQDMGLNAVIRGITHVGQELHGDGVVRYRLEYSVSLFDGLSSDAAIDLMERVALACQQPATSL